MTCSAEQNIRIYKVVEAYLKQIAPVGVNLDKYMVSNVADVKTLQDVFQRFIGSAQNYQQMPNVIQFYGKRQVEIRKLLFDYDMIRVSECSAEMLYRQFRDVFSVQSKDTKQNSWYKWSCSIVDSAKFLKQFNGLEDFEAFVDCFDYNPLSQIALPLLIQSQIRGIGFALACDLLKELGYENYPKPDVHLMDVFSEIGLCEKNQMSVFLAVRQMAEDCKQVDTTVTAYKVDKIFWLICSGLFYNEKPIVKIGSHKKELIERLKGVAYE